MEKDWLWQDQIMTHITLTAVEMNLYYLIAIIILTVIAIIKKMSLSFAKIEIIYLISH
jgi:hypothetical protein